MRRAFMDGSVTTDDIMQVRAHSDVLVSTAAVQLALDEMALRIARSCAQHDPLLLCVMNGGLFTTSEIARRCDFAMQMDYLQVSRYRSATSGGELHWLARPQVALAGRVVVVIDDILDRGNTLAEVLAWCRGEGAAEVLSAVLVDKRITAPRAIAADIVGVQCPDRYLYGCGMDYRGYWRNLPAIYGVRDDYFASLG